MEKYKDLLRVLKEEHIYSLLYILLKDFAPEERKQKLEEVFMLACENIQDDEALGHFTHLLMAVQDIELLPFVNQKGELDDDPLSNALTKAKNSARISRARITLRLLQALCSGERFWFYITKTRGKMFQEATLWWRDTKDEAESDEIFRALSELFVSELFVGLSKSEIGEIEKVFRGVTDSSFPAARLTRHLIMLLQKYSESLYQKSFGPSGPIFRPKAEFHLDELSDRLAHILMLGIVKNKSPLVALGEAKINLALAGCSNAAYNLMEDSAKAIVALDAWTSGLIERTKGGNSLKNDGKVIFGKISYCFLTYSLVEITIEDKSPGCTRNYGASQFEQAFAHIKAYREEHSGDNLAASSYAVKLIGIFRNSRKAEVVFTKIKSVF